MRARERESARARAREREREREGNAFISDRDQHGPRASPPVNRRASRERERVIDNLLVRTHFIILMIR